MEREKEFQNVISLEKKHETLVNESKILTQKLEKTLQMNSILNDKLNTCNNNAQELKSLEARIPLLVNHKKNNSIINYLLLFYNFFTTLHLKNSLLY